MISNRYILTAAHCLDDKRVLTDGGSVTRNSHARYGCNNQASGACIRSTFDWHWVDPNYLHTPYIQGVQSFDLKNDIALLRMSTYFASASDFPSSVGTICLPTEKFPNYETMTALGWGGTDADVSQSDLLKEASIHIFNITIFTSLEADTFCLDCSDFLNGFLIAVNMYCNDS